ncbi:MAG TPA: SulP family inorganic anion transporter [Polaromonas sp.]|nr:SulP family inorganic anion transporter [Polaromonas sp.]HYW55485.1 SulP family inorganic anion transporter [Polaromonas sp.]
MPNLLERLFGSWVRTVSPLTLRADLLAGLLGAVLVLPQGIAFATLAGLPPEYGLYTAIIPAIIAAMFGSSWHVVSGPTNANSLALFAMLSPLALAFSPAYIQLALAVTVLVGVMQWLIGTLRLGTLANFISPAALFGFTSGAAVLIAAYALPDLLGLSAPSARGALAVLAHVASQLAAVQPSALVVAGATMAVALLMRRWRSNWPFMLAGLVVATAVGWVWNRYANDGGAALRMVGQIATPWPKFAIPQISWSSLPELLGLAFALTIVALGQAISIAKAVAERSGQRIDANREFRGQGLSNIVGGFFSSYVSCGSMNRSMPNLEAGARTPLASVFSALLLLALVAVSSSLLAQIPMAALAALLVLVAASLLDLKRWKQLFNLSRTEFGVALATMVATVTIRLEMAILLGTLLSLMSFLYRTSKPAMRSMGFDSEQPDRQFVVLADASHPLPECPQLKLLRMEGEVYFGATQHVADTLHALRHMHDPQKHLLVMGKSMNFIDLAGAELWEDEVTARRALGGDLYFHRPRPEVIQMWQTTGFTRLLGPDHQFADKRSAIATIFPKLDPQICRQCTARIFWECRSVPGPDTSSPDKRQTTL